MVETTEHKTEDERTGSLPKAATLLREVAAGGSQGVSVAALATRCKMARPTVHRICEKLQAFGWLCKDEKSRKLYLGDELCLLGLIAQQKHPLESFARPYLKRLGDDTGQTVYLLKRFQHEAVCIARIEGSERVKTLLLEVGSRWPLGYGAAGMAILSALPEQEADEILLRNLSALSPETETQIRARLRETKNLGFSRHSGLILPGVTGLAAPIFDMSGNPVASVSIAYVESWMEKDRLQQCVEGIPAAARSISQQLGFEGTRRQRT